MLETQTKIIVRYAETDKMGIVHHSNYPIWFEAGRTEFIRELGMQYSKLEQMGLMLPLIGLKCSYKSPAEYEDEIIIKTRIEKFTFTRITFKYEAYKKEEGYPIATGETDHVWANKSLKPINIKKHFPDIYNLLTQALQI